MLEKEILNYNNLLKNWKETNRKKLERLMNTTNPNEFRFFFRQLILNIMDFDKFWNELCNFAVTNLSGFISQANNWKIIIPEKFKLESNKVEIDIRKAMQENENRKRFVNNPKLIKRSVRQPVGQVNSNDDEKIFKVPEYMELFFKDSKDSFNTFIEICGTLEESIERFPTLVNNFYNELTTEMEQSIDELDKKLNSIPPPDLTDLYQDIQKYSESIMIWDSYKNTSLIGELVNYNNQIQNMLQQGSLLTNYRLNFTNQNNILNQSMTNFPDVNNKLRNLEAKRRTLHEKIIKYGIVSGNAPKILKVLEEMNPEFPVFLPRLAELVTLEKAQTEDALNFVLAKSPELGKYDPMAQVLMFSKPTEVGVMIDSLLKKYEGSNIKL